MTTVTTQPLPEPAQQERDLRRIAASSVLLAVLAVVSQFTALLREGTISYFLGTTKVADIYIAAFQPIDVMTSALLLSLPFGLVPFLLMYRERYGPEIVRWSTSRVQLGAVLLVAGGCTMLYPFGSWIIHLSDPVLLGAHLQLSVKLWHWMLPAVVLASATAFFLAELIADHRFFCQGMNPILLNLSIVILAFVCWSLLGVFSLAVGVLLGFSAQFVLQAWTVLKGRPLFLVRPDPQPRVLGNAVSMIGPVVLLYFLGALNAPLLRRFAAQFGEGSLAAFAYAMRAWTPILLIGVLSISYPYFSSFAVAISEDREQARRLLRSMLRACFLFALPAMAAVTLLRHDLVRILFLRGAFNARAAASVSSTIGFLSPVLLGGMLADLLARCLIALRRPLLACAIYAGMLILVWVVAEQMKRFGLGFLALGWSLCFYAGAVGFAMAVSHYLPHAMSKLALPLAKAIAASIVSAICMGLLFYSLDRYLRVGFVGSLEKIVGTLAAGSISMIAASWLLRITEVQLLVRSAANWSRNVFWGRVAAAGS